MRKEIVDLAWDDANTLNGIAWGIAIAKEDRDLELALRAAKRASELRDHKDAAILDTYGRVLYEQGQLAQAIEWQKRAVKQNAGNQSIDSTLEKYEAEMATGSKTGGRGNAIAD